MADAVARRRYAGETRTVTVKQSIQEASVAHPNRVEAISGTGEALVTRFDSDRDHGGADLVDDSIPTTDEAGHGELELPLRSPAMRKMNVYHELSAKSSDSNNSVGCARSRRNWNTAFTRLSCTEEVREARRS